MERLKISHFTETLNKGLPKTVNLRYPCDALIEDRELVTSHTGTIPIMVYTVFNRFISDG